MFVHVFVEERAVDMEKGPQRRRSRAEFEYERPGDIWYRKKGGHC